MSLRPEPIAEIPAETARVARAACPKGTIVTRLRDEFSALYQDEDFRALYPTLGQPGLAPWRLALVTVLQFLEHLSDRQAADAVRARIDWKYALGLELTDPGFHFSVLAEFRARLVAGGAEPLLLDTMLEHFKARGLVKARGKQRTDSTHVLAAVRDLSFLELVTETLRAALDDLAAVAPDWLRGVAKPVWFERYGRRVEDYRLPKSREERARPGGRCGRVRLARRPGRAGCTGRGGRAGDGADAGRRLAGALRARRRTAAVARRCGAAAGGRTGAVALRPRGALQPEAAVRLDRVQGARHGNLRRRCRAPDHARDEPPCDAAGYDEHGRDPRAPGRQGSAPERALRGLRLRGCGTAGRQPTGPRAFARRARPGRLEPRGAWLRAAALHHRLGRGTGDLPARQDIGVLAHDPRHGRRPAHPGPVQPDRLQGVSRQGPVHAGDEHAPSRTLPPARGIRGAECSTGPHA